MADRSDAEARYDDASIGPYRAALDALVGASTMPLSEALAGAFLLLDVDAQLSPHITLPREALVTILRAVRVAVVLRASAPPAITDANGLLPCPFCGGVEIEVIHRQLHDIWSVLCAGDDDAGCMTTGHNYITRADAVAAWNRRAGGERRVTRSPQWEVIHARGACGGRCPYCVGDRPASSEPCKMATDKGLGPIANDAGQPRSTEGK